MDGMSNEYLIRRAYGCGRGGAQGMAEADTCSRFERAVRTVERQRKAIKEETWGVSNKSIDELEYEDFKFWI